MSNHPKNGHSKPLPSLILMKFGIHVNCDPAVANLKF